MSERREVPIEIGNEEFKKIGYQLVDEIAAFLDSIKERPVTTGESSGELQNILGNHSIPEEGIPAEEAVAKATDFLLNHSLLSGHPKFIGYIFSSAAPIGMFAEMLAAAVNPNVGAQTLSPIATEIEKQTIRWLAELIGLPGSYGGILVSGGNMANFTGYLAGRAAKAPKKIKEEGLSNESNKLITYCPETTHTWIEKATVLFGHGTDSIRWIPTNSHNKMDVEILESTIKEDLEKGHLPFIVIGTAGDVSTGVVDDLRPIAEVCKAYDLWFHIDGAYGIPAASIPEYKEMFDGMEEADSIALDPHKWLYNSLEAGCTLVKDPKHLTDAFSSKPEYYKFNKTDVGLVHNFYERGLQNSRGFRAFKVWLTLLHVGKNGYRQMIGEDIELAQLLYELAEKHEELEAVTLNLSVATLRYIPAGIDQNDDAYLNNLNDTLLDALQRDGEVFLSNAIVKEKHCLRACIVNFRTTKKDIREIVDIIVREGRKLHQQLINQ